MKTPGRIVVAVAIGALVVSGGQAVTEATPENISRDLEPVILSGSALGAMQGQPVSQVAAYRYNEGSASWFAIPSQV